jgi:hypothetical protein
MSFFNTSITTYCFGRIGLPCPITFNPADHYIHKLSMVPKHEEEYKERIEFICDKYRSSDFGKTFLLLLKYKI